MPRSTSTSKKTRKPAAAAPGTGLLAAQRRITELFVSAADALGVPRSVGEIYGVIFSSPRPVTFQEIVERLNLSKGSVSQGLKALRNLGAIRQAYVSGERRDYYEPETELRNLVAGLLRNRISPHLELGKRRLERIQKEIASSNETSEEAAVVRARVAKLESWSQQGAMLLPLMAKVLG